MTWDNDVFRALDEQGFRMTTPRQMIVRTITKRDQPFTAEQLVDLLPSVGRATIYRTLDVLAQQHWLTRIHHAEGEHAYVPSSPHQHQLVCSKCGTAVSFDTCDLEAVLKQLAQRTGFVVQGHVVEAFGLCQQCQERPKTR